MDRKDLLDQVIAVETDMFGRVRAAEPSLCQERPETFKTMRAMTHSAVSDETLAAYLQDLEQAQAEGVNLLTLKYARMEGKIGPLKENPEIEQIVGIEEGWMMELAEKYPNTIKGGPGFGVYLASELETYSDGTLALYLRDVTEAQKQGRNLAEERYNWLFDRIGMGSIEQAEEKARNAGGQT